MFQPWGGLLCALSVSGIQDFWFCCVTTSEKLPRPWERMDRPFLNSFM